MRIAVLAVMLTYGMVDAKGYDIYARKKANSKYNPYRFGDFATVLTLTTKAELTWE